MKLPPLVPGRFVRRDNRFRATVVVDGEPTWAHVPNSGRLEELFTPGRPLWLAPAAGPGRKTAYDLKLVAYGGGLVSVDARLPNPLLEEGLRARHKPLGDLLDWPRVEREVGRGDSRLDFCLSGPGGVQWIETKSVTLVEERVALFPDAPTARGRKHLLELIDAVQSGERAAVLLVVQRPDAGRFAPHDGADPAFGAVLRRAARAGVAVRAYVCRVTRQEIELADEIPVDLRSTPALA